MGGLRRGVGKCKKLTTTTRGAKANTTSGKKKPCRCRDCVQTHPTQLTHLGKVFAYQTTLVSAHTATNAWHTGIGNSDAGGQSVVHPHTARQGTLRLDEECHSIYVPDEQCQGSFLPDPAGSSRWSRAIWTQPCVPDAAVSSGRSRVY
jgi:hypothetical protein